MTSRGKSSGGAGAAPGAYVALLRGINVGGKNKLPMKDLCAMFAAAGCTHVRNYIQSGNIVFKAKPALAIKVPGLIAPASPAGLAWKSRWFSGQRMRCERSRSESIP